MKYPQFDIDRRRLVLGGAATLAAASMPRLGLASGSPLEEDDDENILVLVEAAGGNDGLSTIVPHGDDAYHNARSTCHIDPKGLLPLDEYRGFHPELKSMKAAWDRDELAIIEGVGYPTPNRSHFFSKEIWGTGDMRGKVSGDGWIGKLLSQKWGADPHPMRAVHFSGSLSDIMLSTKHPVLCLESPASYRWAQDPEAIADLAQEPTGGKGDALRSRLRGIVRDAKASSLEVRKAVAKYKPNVEYPNSDLGEQLMVAAALIEARVGARVLSVTLSGFDTHAGQKPVHDNLWSNLDASVGAFLSDVSHSSRAKKITVMVFSEFGRRVQENGSRGTDHGAAAPVFLAGPAIKGGLYGKHPSLTDLFDGDLIQTTDFRRIYATLTEDWMKADPTAVLPGTWEKLPVWRA